MAAHQPDICIDMLQRYLRVYVSEDCVDSLKATRRHMERRQQGRRSQA
jgi:hypothetical protein